MSTMSQAMTQ